MSMLQTGLLGLGGLGGLSGGQNMKGLLGDLYDPQELQRQQLKSGLLQAGIAMLGQEPSRYPINFGNSLANGLKAGVQAADQTRENYTNNALMGRKIQQEDQAQQWQSEQQNHQRTAWTHEADQYKAHQDWLASLPPDKRRLAENFPELFGKAQIAEQFPKQDAGKYYGNPQMIQNPDGSYSLLQLNSHGESKVTGLPPGSKIVDPFMNSYMKSNGSAQGESYGKQVASAPSDIQASDNALYFVDQIRNDPNIDVGTGFSSLANAVPGTPAFDFAQRVKQAKSGAFLSAIQQMRGMGALSNAEGDAATAAVNRLEVATSKEEFISALNDYEMIIRQGQTRAKNLINGINPATKYQGGGSGGELSLDDALKQYGQ